MNYSVSLLPPRTRDKLRRLPPAERREYAQSLKGNYEVRRTRIDNTARQMAAEWASEQRAHFEAVLAELDDIVEGRWLAR